LKVLAFIGVVVLVQVLIDRLRGRGFGTWVRIFTWTTVSLALLLGSAAYTDVVVHKVASRAAARPKLFPPAKPRRLRRDLAEVLTHLERPAEAGDNDDVPMLLTNDNMVLAWWAVLGKGRLLMPDVFSVTLPQAAIERNLAQAGRVLGLDEESFVSLLSNDDFNNIFYGHNQYQASVIWHPAPLPDYTSGNNY
jgi:hypothetical protein